MNGLDMTVPAGLWLRRRRKLSVEAPTLQLQSDFQRKSKEEQEASRMVSREE